MAIQNNSNEIYVQWAFFNAHRGEIINTLNVEDYTDKFRCGNPFDMDYCAEAEAVRVIQSSTEYNDNDFWIVRKINKNNETSYIFAMSCKDDPYTTYAICESMIGDIFDQFKNVIINSDSYSPNIIEVGLCNDDVIKGDIFIIPNSIVAIGEYPHHTYLSKKFYEKTNVKINGETVRLEDGDLMVQIWTRGSGSENWSSHGTPFATNDYAEDRFLSELPVKYLQKLKEGDSFNIEFCGQKIKLTLNQINSRYWEKGPFHICLQELVDYFNANHAA